jgi:hypothetical protein
VKKKQAKRPLLRKNWTINPVTRVKESEKKYSRGKAKKNFKKELDES